MPAIPVRAKHNLFGLTVDQIGTVNTEDPEVGTALRLGFIEAIDPADVDLAAETAAASSGCGCGK